jgi:oligoendopeptidase F
MFNNLPLTSDEFKTWPWDRIKPYYDDLAARELTADTLEAWLADWTRLADLISEARWALYIATTVDTSDEPAQQAFAAYFSDIFPQVEAAEQPLRRKLLDSGLQPPGYTIPIQKMQADVRLFCEENLPLLAEEQTLSRDYERIIGAQTVQWEGEEVTLPQLFAVQHDPDRSRREQAYRLGAARQLEDRSAIGELWIKLMDLRGRIARNAGFEDYRAYRWLAFKRFDFTPEDCLAFHDAIEEVVVPAVARVMERRRQQLGVEMLRPWDQYVDPLSRPPLKPYQAADELVRTSSVIFHRVDPALGDYFDTMEREGLLDLANRKGKAPGAYSVMLDSRRRPFIFENAVGLHDDVMTVLHEAGHAFHGFEAGRLPYTHQRNMDSLTMEVAEVASMAMELLAMPYLRQDAGGFYGEADYARARIEHLEGILRFWPYMAVVDAFQHWIYTHHAEATDPVACDARWLELWDRFMPGIDFSGLEDVKTTRWQRQIHIHTDPFYYVDYGLAQMGAVQVWRNAIRDQAGAVAKYRHALSLGSTVGTRGFYEAAGAQFAFDAGTLRQAVDLIVETIDALERG